MVNFGEFGVNAGSLKSVQRERLEIANDQIAKAQMSGESPPVIKHLYIIFVSRGEASFSNKMPPEEMGGAQPILPVEDGGYGEVVGGDAAVSLGAVDLGGEDFPVAGGSDPVDA